MKSNWEEKAENIFKNEFNLGTKHKEDEITLDWEYIWKAAEKCMNLVFEATKKECADNFYIVGGSFKEMKESILNINKPNL